MAPRWPREASAWCMEVREKRADKEKLGSERERRHWFRFFLRAKLDLLKTRTPQKHITGGNIGLMGAVAESVQAGGQSVVGVIPKALQPREVRGGLGEGRRERERERRWRG